jgi:hypothetical protein
MNCTYLVLALACTTFIVHTGTDKFKQYKTVFDWTLVLIALLLVHILPAFLWWQAGVAYGAHHA